MSLNPDIRDRAYQFFIEEAQELLQTIENGLIDLQGDYSTSNIHELMRAAHSIKGGAASVELETIKILAHRLEDFFKALYSDKVEFNTELETLLLKAYDCLRDPLIEQIENGSFDEESAVIIAQPIFEQLETILGDALAQADRYIPSASDLGVDIVASIFEVDVAQCLKHLTGVLEESQNFDVIAEFRTQMAVLEGLAELFNFSGFDSILKLTNTAIDNYPEKALSVLEIFIRDCYEAREIVLEGDRDRGGEPSEELKKLAGNFNNESKMGEPIVEVNPDPPKLDLSNQSVAEIANSLSFDFEEAEDDLENLEDMFASSLLIEEEIPLTSPEVVVSEEEASGDDFFADFSDSDSMTLSQFFIPDFASKNNKLLVNKEEVNVAPDENENIEVDPPSVDEIFGTTDTEIGLPDLPPQTSIETSVEEELKTPEDIDMALESIDKVFDSLPNLDVNLSNNKIVVEENKLTKKKPLDKKNRTINSSSNLTVRVDLERLDRMNNLIGELIINRNSLSLQNKQLQENVRDLVAKFSRFRKITGKLRSLSDKLLVDFSKNQNQKYFNVKEKNIKLPTSNFDSLEMDKYNAIDLFLQTILEEMVQLEESVEDISFFSQQSDRSIHTQHQMLGQIRDEMMWARMLPLDNILKRFPRNLRELCHKYNKEVNLELIGTRVLVDKAVLEKLYDPLLHLLRNCFDHGIEAPKIRKQKGKPPEGKITIQAYYQGNKTIIEIKDDGQGLNSKKIAKKSVEMGLISEKDIINIRQDKLFNLIFEPGFSTSDRVSEISGRGMGMNVVREQIESLKGTIKVNSYLGEGTIFTLSLPLTLTIAKLLVCSLGTTAFALPSDSIEEIVIPLPEQVKFSGSHRFLYWQDKLIPIYNLQERLQYNCTTSYSNTNSKIFDSVAPPEDWALPLLLLRRGQDFFALEIKQLITEEELVIKPFGSAIAPPQYIYGCTILSDGTLIPVFNGAALIREFVGEKIDKKYKNNEISLDFDLLEEDKNSEPIDNIPTSSLSFEPKRILLIDDSTALRRTMALSLEKQGYTILQAKDGRDGLEKIKKNPDIDLIVCDVEMPNMNGFEFLGVRRRDSALTKIPVIMLTSRSGLKHRNLAIQLGANDYFTKPYVEQEFLKELNRIFKERELNNNPDTSAENKIQTILVIDDSSALRRTLCLTLENENYRVLQARDGEEGLEQMKQNPDIGLVICDIEMPNMNGIDFLNARRTNSNFQTIPVAMLSSATSNKYQKLVSTLGGDAYFVKPYNESKFLPQIKKLINKKINN